MNEGMENMPLSNEEKELDYTVLTKLPVGSALHIEVYYMHQKLEYDVQIAGEAEGGLLFQPIMREGKMMNFMSSKLRILAIYYIKGEKPILWSHCQIKEVMYKGNPYHYIKTNHLGIVWNRRNDFRLYIGDTGVAQMGENHVALKVNIRDVSNSGFSIIAPRDVAGTNENCRVHLVFRDIKNDKQFSLFGMVVRKEELEDGAMMFGCRLDKYNASLSRYIAKRQRESAIGSTSLP